MALGMTLGKKIFENRKILPSSKKGHIRRFFPQRIFIRLRWGKWHVVAWVSGYLAKIRFFEIMHGEPGATFWPKVTFRENYKNIFDHCDLNSKRITKIFIPIDRALKELQFDVFMFMVTSSFECKILRNCKIWSRVFDIFCFITPEQGELGSVSYFSYSVHRLLLHAL